MPTETRIRWTGSSGTSYEGTTYANVAALQKRADHVHIRVRLTNGQRGTVSAKHVTII
jgi:hypothetical protein